MGSPYPEAAQEHHSAPIETEVRQVEGGPVVGGRVAWLLSGIPEVEASCTKKHGKVMDIVENILHSPRCKRRERRHGCSDNERSDDVKKELRI